MFGSKQDKERQARMQRLLARDQGYTPEDPIPTGQIPPLPGMQRAPTQPRPEREARARPAGKTKSFSALQKRQRRRRNGLLLALVLAAAIVVAGVTGAIGTSLALLGDAVDSLYLSVNLTGGGWPVDTGITQPIQIEALAGGFVELGAEDVAVYSSKGAKIRAFQPGYARPAIAVGNTRFCVYNRSGTELRVESRTKNLYTKSFADGILLCAMSNNGSTAVVTQSSRYAAQVTVYDPLFAADPYLWAPTQTDGTPVSLAFAGDNHRFAAGCLSAVDGQLCTKLFLMDTNSDAVTATYTATAGSMILELHWLSSTRLLAVFDHYAAIINPSTGAEAARFDYGGSTLKSVSVGGKNTAFLLSGHSGSELELRDEALGSLARVLVGQANTVDCTGTGAYVLGDAAVRRYQFDGICNWEQSFDNRPLRVVDAAKPLLFSGATAELLLAPVSAAQ